MSSHTVAPHVGREYTFTALGRSWTAARWTLDVWDAFLQWARTVLPDPMEEAEKACLRLAVLEAALTDKLPLCKSDVEKAALKVKIAALQGMQAQWFRQGMDKGASYLAVSSPEVSSLIRSVRGSAHALYLLLLPNHPDVTEETAYQLSLSLTPEQQGELWATVNGRSPGDAGKNGSAPAG